MSIKNNINQAEILFQQGQYNESMELCEKVLAKKPKLFDALQVKALNLQATGDLQQAIETFELALTVKNNHASTYNNLGNIYLAVQDYHKASQQFKKALSFEQLMPEANNNLASCLVKLGDYKLAEEHYRKAILHDATIADFPFNLGILLTDKGEFSQAQEFLMRALTLNAEKTGVYWQMMKINMYLHRYQDALEIANSAFVSKSIPDRHMCEILIGCAMIYWLFFRFEDAAKAIELSEKIYDYENESHNMANLVIFHRYIKKLLMLRKQENALYPQSDQQAIDTPEMYFISESHGFAPNGTLVNYKGQQYQINSLFVLGTKLFHLLTDAENKYQVSVSSALQGLPAGSKVVLGFGEIDCRYNEGIYIYCQKSDKSYQEVIDSMVGQYIKTMREIADAYQIEIILYGVPAPHQYYVGMLEEEQQKEFTSLIAYFNQQLATCCKESELAFLDVYNLTLGEHQMSSLQYHIDGIHMSPKAVPELFEKLN